jgi:hypothetical protein
MNHLTFGLIAGLAFGVLDVLLMIPLSLPDKRTAMLGAFADRFAIGFLTAVVALPFPGWARGLLVGVLISLPSAIVTKTYVPILVVGAIGGIVIGALSAKFAP